MKKVITTLLLGCFVLTANAFQNLAPWMNDGLDAKTEKKQTLEEIWLT